MKNILKLTLALAAMLVISSAATTASAQKFGRINMNELLQMMPEMKTVEANIQKIIASHNEIFDQMRVEYNTRTEEFTKNNATWTEAIRNMKQQELATLVQRLESYQQTASEDISENEKTLMAPVIEKAVGAVSAVAKANGFTTIFDLRTGALAYYDEATVIDALPLVKKHLGIN